jgi:ABC-type nitrate/sulfonate/bicarbonate transport system substrate-binding protein
MEALCAKLGISLRSFERVPVQFDPRPFVAGQVDVLPVYLIDQPVDLRAKGLDLNLIDPSAYGVSLAFGNVYFTTEQTIRERPALVRAFLMGASAGWRWAYRNRERAVDILSRVVPETEKSTLRAKLDATFDFIDKDSPSYLGVFPMRAESWQSTYDILRRYGNLTTELAIGESFTNSYVAE